MLKREAAGRRERVALRDLLAEYKRAFGGRARIRSLRYNCADVHRVGIDTDASKRWFLSTTRFTAAESGSYLVKMGSIRA